jgi:hypothetical protein
LESFKNGNIVDGEEAIKSKDTTEKGEDDQQGKGNNFKMFITEAHISVPGDSHTVELKIMPMLVLPQTELY